MSERKRIPLEEYCIVVANPINRLNAAFVNIYKDGRFNMNSKLALKLGGKKINIRFTKDVRYFMMVEGVDENAIIFPKNGSKKIDEISSLLSQHKVTLPAQYEVWFDEETEIWRGELAANPTIPAQIKHHNSKAK